MIDLVKPFHVGLVVPDVAEAMDTYSKAMGVTWYKKQYLELDILVDGAVVSTSVHFNYTVEGPVQLELCSGPAGSFWDPAAHEGLNHVGYWTDDFDSDIAKLMSQGWRMRNAGVGEEGKPAAFAYVISPQNHQVEIIDEAMRPIFENWYAGGDFGLPSA